MIVSIDLGSRWCGLTALEDEWPPRVYASGLVEVDLADLDKAEAQIIGAIDLAIRESKARKQKPPRVVIEWGRFYVPKKATPEATAAAGAAMGEARDPMICLRDRAEQHCKACRIKVVRIPARTWRVRIGCDGQGDGAVSAALAVRGLPALGSEHERDALGAALGVLIGERDKIRNRKPCKRAPYVPAPHILARRAQDAALDAMVDEQRERIAVAPPALPPSRCQRGCGERTHRGPCGLAERKRATT